ncbi:MAG: hypothetical protein ACO2O5_00260 [Candidatus Caldipriscus sp.]
MRILGNDLDFNSDETFQFAEIRDSFCTDAVWVGDINNRSPRI